MSVVGQNLNTYAIALAKEEFETLDFNQKQEKAKQERVRRVLYFGIELMFAVAILLTIILFYAFRNFHIFIMALLFAILIADAVFIAVRYKKRFAMNDDDLVIYALSKNKKSLNKKDFKNTLVNELCCDQYITMNSTEVYKPKLLISRIKNLFAIEKYDGIKRIYKYENLLGYEVFENNVTTVSRKRDEERVGREFYRDYNPRNQEPNSPNAGKFSKTLVLVIYLQNCQESQLEAHFIADTSLDKTTFEYKKIRDNIYDICHALEKMLDYKK